MVVKESCDFTRRRNKWQVRTVKTDGQEEGRIVIARLQVIKHLQGVIGNLGWKGCSGGRDVKSFC